MKFFIEKSLVAISVCLLLGMLHTSDVQASQFLEKAGKSVSRAGKSAKRKLSHSANKAKKTAGKTAKSVTRETKNQVNAGLNKAKNVANVVGNQVRNVSPSRVNQVKREYGGMMRVTRVTLEHLARNNAGEMRHLTSAIRRQDCAGVLNSMARLTRDNTALRDLIRNAERKNFGSLMIFVSVDSTYNGVSGAGAIGAAVDIKTLANYAQTGRWNGNNRPACSIFATAGVALGADSGASVDVCCGFHINSPMNIGGASLDINAEREATSRGSLSLGFNPNTFPFQFNMFAVGASGGLEFGVTGGGSKTWILKSYRLR